MKILTVFGTRPEAIKLAPLIKAFEGQDDFESVVCVSSQHREMLDQVLELFGIQPHYDLDIMTPNQSLASVTARVLTEVEEIVREEQPDFLVVQGDTTTTMAGALAGFYGRTRVAHVEAGLRSFSTSEPFPEEMNRRVASVLADVHFAPTNTARENLLREGVDESRITVTGNTGIDSLFLALELAGRRGPAPELSRVREHADGRRIVLVTAHRRESFGEPFAAICQALLGLVNEYDDVLVVYPVHLNPNIREPAHRTLGRHPRILLLEPLQYGPFVELLDAAYLILTDSGGIQEEAPSLGKPVLVLRNVTERMEAIEAGTACLVGTDTQRILQTAGHLLDRESEYRMMSARENPFGDGHACLRITSHLRSLAGETAS